MIKWMFVRGVYFICKIFPDIGKIIIEHASNFFFVRDGLAVHLFCQEPQSLFFGLLSRLLIVSHVFLMSLLYLLNSL